MQLKPTLKKFSVSVAAILVKLGDKEAPWNEWILYGWVALGVLGLALEFLGLHNDKDNLPPLTEILTVIAKKHWWVAIPVLAFPIWLVIHFGRRIFRN